MYIIVTIPVDIYIYIYIWPSSEAQVVKRAPKAQQGWTWVAELERNKENSWRIGRPEHLNEWNWMTYIQSTESTVWLLKQRIWRWGDGDDLAVFDMWDKNEWCVQRGKWLKDVEDTGREKQEDNWEGEANCCICYIFAARPLPTMDDFHLSPGAGGVARTLGWLLRLRGALSRCPKAPRGHGLPMRILVLLPTV